VQCLILAGGLATRLGDVTRRVPKALLPVAGRPFADHQLEWLAREGFTDIVFSIAHLGHQIRDHVGDGSRFGLRVVYVDEGPVLRGTGGAVRLAYDEGVLEEIFGVLYGDAYLSVPFRRAWATFAQRKPAVLMTVFRNAGRWDTSNAELRPDGLVVYDKGAPDRSAMDYIDYGFSIFDRDEVCPGMPPDTTFDVADTLRDLSLGGQVLGFEVHERFYEIGSHDGLAELEQRLSAPDHAPDRPDPRNPP
jgi:MurNAc alpha-1-phosphate uridylyltransferase